MVRHAPDDEALRPEDLWGMRDAAVLRKRADQRQRKFGFRYNLTRLVNGRRKLTSGIKGEVLTDDFAPANMLKAIEERNRKWE